MLFKMYSEYSLHQNLVGCLVKIQISRSHLSDPLDQNLQDWSLGICTLTPPLGTLIHSRATGALVLGGGAGCVGGGGMERS